MLYHFKVNFRLALATLYQQTNDIYLTLKPLQLKINLNSILAVARFLITRKGLSKQMIGEYLGSINSQFNMQVLNCFAQEMDFSGMHIDIALRKFQTYFRMPGEAQKIERLMQVFSGRYCQCNREFLATLHSSDTVFILAFAIILLNTDLHTPNIKVNYSQFFSNI